jgi:hypothetical protein
LQRDELTSERKGSNSRHGGTIAFCLSLNPGIPFIVLFVAVYDFREKSGLFAEHVDILVMYILAALADAVMIYLAVTTMADLWARQPDSVRGARRLIVIFIVWWVVINYLPFFAYLPDSKKEEFEWRLYRGSQTLMIFSSLWFLSLARLRKAFNTFEKKDDQNSRPVV